MTKLNFESGGIVNKEKLIKLSDQEPIIPMTKIVNWFGDLRITKNRNEDEGKMKGVYQVIVIDEKEEIVVDKKVIAFTEDGAKFEAGANTYHPDKTTIIVTRIAYIGPTNEKMLQ